MAASNGSEFFAFEIESGVDPFSRPSNAEAVIDAEELLWDALARLPSQKQKQTALLRRTASESDGGQGRTETIDVRKLDRLNRQLVVKKALATNEQDNFKLLSAIKERLDRVGLAVPEVEVRFEDLNITANVQIGSRALPTLINFTRNILESFLTTLRLIRPERHSLTILKKVSGSVQPGRMTLLLGPPGSGKSTLLLALAGKLDGSLKASAYGGKKHSISTDYVLRVLGLDVCAETFVGNDMLRGVSGGQRKRVTTAFHTFNVLELLFMCWHARYVCLVKVSKSFLFSKGQEPSFNSKKFLNRSAYSNNTVGNNILQHYSLPSSGYWYWLGVGILLLYSLFFNCIVTLALAHLNPIRKAQAVILPDSTEEDSAAEVGKFILYLLFMFLTFCYFTFYGMMAVGLTPSQHLAAVVSSAFYSLWNLLSGFLVPKPHIPGWWIWFYYLSPVAWTLRGIITSQLGDVETRIMGTGFQGSVKEYLVVSLGYEPGMIAVSAVVCLCFGCFFFVIFAISVKVLNFQKR
ncbi:ABC-2 type transporter [Dillenia turbinata]|uniref:ABC-2 type transporter n=1 Tax=Dillenia turbinata TaxID=194707 RepID=A0AAN8Z5C1_9MAGN